jgi:methylated-DNA-[protein]-cysteine S-methyltransferase
MAQSSNSTPRFCSHLPSPIGPLLLCGNGTALTAVLMATRRHPESVPSDARPDDGPFREARRQLEAYFAGELREFTLELAPEGTLFRQKVWRALAEIPYGATESYGSVAERIGLPQAARAVGLANGRNPISIVVPCHRVIGKSGALVGYGGGLERKQWLLAHEQRHAVGAQQRLPGL